jgi:hypothetical protein
VYLSEPVVYLLATLFGLVVIVVGAGLGTRAYRKANERARREIDEKIAILAESFPAAVQAWGGAKVLHDPNTMRELLRVLQESAK